MTHRFLSDLRAGILSTLILGVACCGLYPLIVFGIGKALFPDQAAGSLIRDQTGLIRGSKLLGQNFSGEGYFHPRPSVAGHGYDAANSGGSNLGPTSRKLHDALKVRADTYRKRNGLPSTDAVPADAVTASASGLDPHISLQNAALQARRVARARQLELQKVLGLVRENTDGPDLGILGEPGVNVLKLNLALDAISATR
ncbi:MAG: K(+)-transporting ATPase subunit C [Verrucomicrobiales bacterium]|nr:K(+)-transporting ATPase subunit C [Verrucomicrobiales bacterium]